MSVGPRCINSGFYNAQNNDISGIPEDLRLFKMVMICYTHFNYLHEVAMEQQVKSKKRVADHGEVFTAEREVNAMLDLVKSETERIESRFLEPACGNGNFLAEILRRKLTVVKRMYGKNPADYEKWSIIALMNIYGVELLNDNAAECRERLYGIWNEAYTAACNKDANDECRRAARFVLEKNILCGNALSLKKVDASGQDTTEPIIFAEWTFILGSKVKRRDFRLDVLLEENTDQENYSMQMSLFGDEVSNADNWMIDPETNKPTPKPIREFEPKDYRRIWEDA